MLHLIDGWPLDFFDGEHGRKVTDGSSVAGSRPAVDVSDVSLPGRRGKLPSFFGAPGEAFYTVEDVRQARDIPPAYATAATGAGKARMPV